MYCMLFLAVSTLCLLMGLHDGVHIAYVVFLLQCSFSSADLQYSIRFSVMYTPVGLEEKGLFLPTQLKLRVLWFVYFLKPAVYK